MSVFLVTAMLHPARDPSVASAVRESPCGNISSSSTEFATPLRASKRSAVEMIGDTPNQEKAKQHKHSWMCPLDATYEKPFAGLGRSSGASGKSKPKKKVYAIFNNYETVFKCHDPALEEEFDEILISSYGDWTVNRDRNVHHKVPYPTFSKWLEEDLEGKGWELVKQRGNSQHWGKSPKK